LVDFNDYQILENHFGSIYTAPASDVGMDGGPGGIAGVPEPSVLALGGIAMGALLGRRRR